MGVNMKMQIRNTYRREDGRWVAYCVDDKGNPHIVSYPIILMAQKLGRPLEPNEDIHHIDGNPDNNSLDNLELQEHGEHQREHFQKYVDTTEICMIFGKQEQIDRNIYAEWVLNGETLPNGNTVPIT